MYKLITNREEYQSELTEVVRAFLSDENGSEEIVHTFEMNIDTGTIINRVRLENFADILPKNFCYETPRIKARNALEFTRLELRCCKLALYKALEGVLERHLPWGSLTGIRPTKLAYQFIEGGLSADSIADELEKTFLVSPSKAELTQRIVYTQSAFTDERMRLCTGGSFDHRAQCDQLYNLYVHIPFCPSRCDYCSFISVPVDQKKWLVQPYVDALCNEITQTIAQFSEQGKKLFSVYIGGGTPTALTAAQLKQVLLAIGMPQVEHTCEAGRPDTIDEEKLDIMLACGVNRVSVNPQTLNDETLKRIGRNHTAEAFLKAYDLAKTRGLRINVDLIAGLEGETIDDFMQSLSGVLALRPHNVTVHTLSRKRGSALIESAYRCNQDVEAMVDYSVLQLNKAGYAPYYLYRQKQMLGNLENIGYSLPGDLCVNNITTMEETLSVAACGAGAISKRIYAEGRIERLANVRDVMLYLDQFDQRLEKKKSFFA